MKFSHKDTKPQRRRPCGEAALNLGHRGKGKRSIEARLRRGRRGFGSVRVTVTLGDSRWQTSLFPNKDGSWFLPVKKPVREAEGLLEGDEVEVTLELD